MKRPDCPQFGMVALQAILFYFVASFFSEAFAASSNDTLGDVIKGGASSYKTAPSLINYISYSAGVLAALTGIGKLRQSVDRPEQVPKSHGLWYLFASGLLISLPSAVLIVQKTLLVMKASGTTKSATGIALKTSGTGLDVMMVRLIKDISGPMELLLWTLGVVMGLFFMITAFIRMSKGAGQDGPRGSLSAGTIMRIVIGAILFSTAATTDIFTTTLFGSTIVKFQGMSISGVDSSTLDRANQAISAILVFVQILGFIAFMRGFLMLRALADGNNGVSTSAAFTHIFGGAVAINISPMLNALSNTFCSGGCGVATFGT